MSQPVTNIGPNDVARLLTRDFGESADDARAILGALSGTHPGAVASVSAAAIRLSGGDLEELRSAVAMGLADWRHVLCAAEYPRYMQLHDDPTPADRAAAIEADGAEIRPERSIGWMASQCSTTWPSAMRHRAMMSKPLRSSPRCLASSVAWE